MNCCFTTETFNRTHGLRVEQELGTQASLPVKRLYIMDGVHVILEKAVISEEVPVTIARYIPGVCMITKDDENQPVIRYYHEDALGSFVAMTDEDQNLTALYQSDAWGNELLATEDVPNPYRWNGASGYYRDNDAQLYLLGMRWYDAQTGRFVSRDPIGFEGGDVNFCRYVSNNPIHGRDPLGLLKACYRPVENQAWLGWLAPLWHSYIEFSNGSTDSNVGSEAKTAKLVRCYPAVVDDSRPECKSMTIPQIEACLRKEIAKDTSKYHLICNNCGDWVREKFVACCLKNPTPWWLVY